MYISAYRPKRTKQFEAECTCAYTIKICGEYLHQGKYFFRLFSSHFVLKIYSGEEGWAELSNVQEIAIGFFIVSNKRFLQMYLLNAHSVSVNNYQILDKYKFRPKLSKFRSQVRRSYLHGSDLDPNYQLFSLHATLVIYQTLL